MRQTAKIKKSDTIEHTKLEFSKDTFDQLIIYDMKRMVGWMPHTLDKANSKSERRAHHIAHQFPHLRVHQRYIWSIDNTWHGENGMLVYYIRQTAKVNEGHII